MQGHNNRFQGLGSEYIFGMPFFQPTTGGSSILLGRGKKSKEKIVKEMGKDEILEKNSKRFGKHQEKELTQSK